MQKKILLGNPLPEFLRLQAMKAKQELRPFHKIYCGLSCEIAISIPIYIEGKTASLTLASELLPAIIYASESLSLDIGLLNQTELFKNNEINKDYPFEVLTNIKDNALIMKKIAKQKKDLTTLHNGYQYNDDITDKNIYIWGTTIGEKGSEATFLFLKDITLTMHKYQIQKKSILFHSAAISFGIIFLVFSLSQLPKP